MRITRIMKTAKTARTTRSTRTSGARQAAAPLIKFSLFALVTILATALLAATIVNISFTPEHTYRAVFSDVTGLEKGDDIRVAGVRVGQVEGIRIKDRTLAEVTFTVGEGLPSC